MINIILSRDANSSSTFFTTNIARRKRKNRDVRSRKKFTPTDFATRKIIFDEIRSETASRKSRAESEEGRSRGKKKYDPEIMNYVPVDLLRRFSQPAGSSSSAIVASVGYFLSTIIISKSSPARQTSRIVSIAPRFVPPVEPPRFANLPKFSLENP